MSAVRKEPRPSHRLEGETARGEIREDIMQEANSGSGRAFRGTQQGGHKTHRVPGLCL